jgi:steroid 5-alpha-reductase/3-oxo-5-alpha-steroid 4-dehydrogenase 1
VSEAAIYDGIIYAWFAIAAVTIVALLFLSAPYGRHMRAGWGRSIASRTGWIVMEMPAALVLPACFVVHPATAPVAYVMLALWELHYLGRTFVFPLRMKSPAKPMPLSIAAMGAFFNLVNGYLNGRWLTLFGDYETTWLVDPRFLIGAVIMLAGYAINQRADATLRTLRAPGETTYKIPEGGLYRFVSCPNYLGEIVEWIGWAILTWSLAGLSFAVWTAANLAPRALSNHRWYREQFSDYPATRRALIPFVL